MTFQYFFFDTYVGDFLQVLPAAVLAAAICGLCRRRKLRRAGERWRWQDTWKTLLVSYLTGLLALVAVPSALWNTIWYSLFYGNTGAGRFQFFTPVYNLVPDFFRNFSLENLGNLLLFLPFGVLYPLARGEGRFGRTLGAAAILTVAIELFQPVVGRSFDINDICLNFFGSALSAAVTCLLWRLIKKRRDSRNRAVKP